MATPDADKPVPPAPAGDITSAAIAAEPPKRLAAASTVMATSKRIKVRTTLPAQPFLPAASRPAIHTARLELRAIVAADLEGVHALRTQPAVMVFTAVGRVDRDRAETQVFLDRFLPPNDTSTFNFAIRLRGSDEIIGTGGVHRCSGSALGWPEVGYMFKKEHWGKGYATEFLGACMGAWWALPREERVVEVDAESVEGGDGEGEGEGREAPEMVTAIVEGGNPNSVKVLKKVGFREFKRWIEKDSREGYDGREVTLIGLAATSPGQ
ncbi:acetyltransferase domain-containing protein [Camillea tinctor]|nr:acetyltransferase domain-containing protein [Camillea tinctor]